MPPPSAIQGDGSVQQGLSAAYESIAFCKHRRAADKRFYGDFLMTRLSGWQRIGVVLSVLWCLVVAGLAAKDYHAYFQEVATEIRIAECRERARQGPSPEKNERACGFSLSELYLDGSEKAARPATLPYIALLALPITGGWFVVCVVTWVIRWVRAGFKAMSESPMHATASEPKPAILGANAPPTAPPKTIGAVGWVLFIMLALLYSGIGLNLMDHAKISPNQLV